MGIDGGFAVAEVDGGFAEDVVLAEFAEALVVGGDGGFVGGDLLLLGCQLGLLGLQGGLLCCELRLGLLDLCGIGGDFLHRGLSAGLCVHGGLEVGAFELDAVGDDLVLVVGGAADLDRKAGDESGHGHLLGAAVEDSFDLADVGAVGEEDCGVGGRIDGLERHGGAAATVDDSLNFGLSDGEMGDAVDSTMRLMDLAVGRLFIIVTSTWSSLCSRGELGTSKCPSNAGKLYEEALHLTGNEQVQERVFCCFSSFCDGDCSRVRAAA